MAAEALAPQSLTMIMLGGSSATAGNAPAMSLIDHLSQTRFSSIPFAAPKSSSRTTEAALVRDVLEMLQGYSSKSFSWDEANQQFHVETGVHLSHLSLSSVSCLVQRFVCAASSLRRIGAFVKRVADASCTVGSLRLQAPPTLQAFASAVSMRLEHLRKVALERELVAVGGGAGTTVTLLSLLGSLSWVCAGAEFLEQVVNEAIPHGDILCEGGLSAGELGAHILSFLYDKMSDFCLLQDGEEEPYGTLLMLFAGSIQPLVESLDMWLHEGILDDPYGEMFFYANRSIAIEDSTFWQQGFHLRYFKSLNLVDDTRRRTSESVLHCFVDPSSTRHRVSRNVAPNELQSDNAKVISFANVQDILVCPNFLQPVAKSILSAGKSLQLLQHVHRDALDELSSHDHTLAASSLLPLVGGLRPTSKIQKMREEGNQFQLQAPKVANSYVDSVHEQVVPSDIQKLTLQSQSEILEPKDDIGSECVGLEWSCILPPLDDHDLRNAIFTSATNALHQAQVPSSASSDKSFNASKNPIKIATGTDYGSGSGCGNLLLKHVKLDLKAMKRLFPLPTVLPSSKEGLVRFSLHPTSRYRVAAVMFDWLRKAELKVTPLPQILVQDCLIQSIQKQVETVGKQVLNKLMGEWRLMEELSVLRAIYLSGSGDLLQQFSSVLFNKLDRGEPWDDFYELNTMLQESVRSSADGVLIPTLDSLVVNVQTRSSGADQGSVPLHFSGRNLTFGIDTLDSLYFVYKVPWPLELIIDKNAIKKYNQVMGFLFKVKRAKYALDKACRWMWKNGGGDIANLKRQLLLQQQLMHFVNTLHQYVMDRVLYSAWMELCEGMAAAHSLDEVIACHDSYLVSIQRQCLVAPDKLWALISTRVKTILSLALDFYSIQRTLCSGGAAPAVKAKCHVEIERVGRQFDECIVFLLRVLSFKLNVGHFPHLAELVTRINYNYYYVSESGHLLTPLPEITGGKGFQQAKLNAANHG